jgi:4-hydroxybenzoyl-CoA reductase subunit beta
MLRLPPFDLLLPRSVAEAVELKARHGEHAAYVAGGTDLFPHMKRGTWEPEVVLSIQHLSELAGIEALPDGGLRIGAGVSLAEAGEHPAVQRAWPALATALRQAATPTIRSMGTVGGNLCLDTRCNYYDQSEPWRKSVCYCLKKDGSECAVAPSSTRCWAVQASDSAPVAVALGATIELAGPRGSRDIAARDFFADDGIRYLTKGADELLTAIRLPASSGTRSAYSKVARRGSFDFPVLGVAAWIRQEAPGAPVQDARLVLGAVASAPMLIDGAAEALLGRPLSTQTIAAAADLAWQAARPLDNLDHTAAWRKSVIRAYVSRTLAGFLEQS